MVNQMDTQNFEQAKVVYIQCLQVFHQFERHVRSSLSVSRQILDKIYEFCDDLTESEKHRLQETERDIAIYTSRIKKMAEKMSSCGDKLKVLELHLKQKNADAANTAEWIGHLPLLVNAHIDFVEEMQKAEGRWSRTEQMIFNRRV